MIGSAPRLWPPRSAYVHVPFCHRRCFYCDFAVVPLGDRADGGRSGSVQAYLELLQREIHAAPHGPPLSTIYVGGGTPSICTPDQIAGILRSLRQRFGLAPGAEVTLEMDPASFDRPRLAGMLDAGINRVSLGGQSFSDVMLERLGRRHRRVDLERAGGWLTQALLSGDLRSWSLDLIQAAPGETRHSWDEQLCRAIALGPPHLSIYDLSVEPGTVFARQRDRGALVLPDEDLAADLMLQTAATLARHGYGHYEISNFALPGHASRHNRVYWSGAGWWGFGLGATSAPAGTRESRPRTRAAYEAWLRDRLTPSEAPEPGLLALLPFDEQVLVGLRRREGVHLSRLAEACAIEPAALADLIQRWQPWLQSGLLQRAGGRWWLSEPEGMALSNGPLRELLDWWDAWPDAAAAEEPSPAGSPRTADPPPAVAG
nr:radical SAM family heme chaperone HemW [Synechococcus sp. RSCCF101]